MPIRSWSVLLLLAAAAGCAGDRRPAEKTGRTVVAVYTDVDGVCFSADGANYARFTDFLEREENVALTSAQLQNLVEALEREGLFREKNRAQSPKSREVPPAIFRICVVAPGRSKECVLLCEAGSQVPAKYREILKGLPLTRIPAALARFLDLNQHCEK